MKIILLFTFSESGWAREVFIDVFSVADLCHQDHKSIIMNFVNDAVISRSYFVILVEIGRAHV